MRKDGENKLSVLLIGGAHMDRMSTLNICAMIWLYLSASGLSGLLLLPNVISRGCWRGGEGYDRKGINI